MNKNKNNNYRKISVSFPCTTCTFDTTKSILNFAENSASLNNVIIMSLNFDFDESDTVLSAQVGIFSNNVEDADNFVEDFCNCVSDYTTSAGISYLQIHETVYI